MVKAFFGRNTTATMALILATLAGPQSVQAELLGQCQLATELGSLKNTYPRFWSTNRLAFIGPESAIVFDTERWGRLMELNDLKSADISVDGTRIATIQNNQATLWDTQTGQVMFPLGPAGDALRFSYSGELLAISGQVSSDNVLSGARLLKVGEYSEFMRFDGLPHLLVNETEGILAAFWSGAPVGLMSSDTMRLRKASPAIHIWDMKNQRKMREVRHEPWVSRLALAGRSLVSSDPFDKKSIVWNVQTGDKADAVGQEYFVQGSSWSPSSGVAFQYGRFLTFASTSPGNQPFLVSNAFDDRKRRLPYTISQGSYVNQSWGGNVLALVTGDRAVFWDPVENREYLNIPAANAKYAIALLNGSGIVYFEDRIEYISADRATHVALPGDALGFSTNWQNDPGIYAAFPGRSRGPVTVYDSSRNQTICQTDGGEFGATVTVSGDGRYMLVGRYITKEWWKDGTVYSVYSTDPPPAPEIAAAETLKKSIALGQNDRDRAANFLSQGFELFKVGEFDAAVLRFTQGLAIDPANGAGHFYLAETYMRLNKKELARQHYRNVLVFSPDSKEAAIAQVRLEGAQ